VIPVDPSGDGGLTDITLSPTYSQDRLMYAYISTPTDNRVVRIADGDIVKPILIGIPKGATGNMGALIFTSPTTLVVLTGDAGNPAQSGDPGSLAGKVLRIEQPTTVDQAPQTTALSGIGAGGGMCIDRSDDSLYITDRTPTADRLRALPRTPRCRFVDLTTVPFGGAPPRRTVLVNLSTQTNRRRPNGTDTGASPVIRRLSARTSAGTRGRCGVAGWKRVGATVNKTAGAQRLDDVVFPLFHRRRVPTQ
jgi:hypothetical protein